MARLKRSSQASLMQTPVQFRFDESLALFQYMLSLFGKESLDSLCQGMKSQDWEGWDEQGISRFYHFLTSRLIGFPGISNEQLLLYDQNITRHTQVISGQRGLFRWKYFQYMALLFTELYLDKYFNDQAGLLVGLNARVDLMNTERRPVDCLDPYTADDLNKIAFWQATGSGKTLIMHVNILQYRHYVEKSGRKDQLNRIILLTPNEGLSDQHLKEFRLSAFEAELFNKDATGTFLKQDIEILDVHKLKEEGKEKTISVDAFEGNNLVMVDEGHMGASGEEWMKMRNRLCQDGFSFEYSATFGQAVKAANKKDMFKLYSRCILFDYSYKYFYNDGYGKEYSILNLAEDQYDDQRQLYLTACLLAFYQQLKVYDSKARELAPFNIEEPLWVFVGKTVNKGTARSRQEVTDIISVLSFFRRFIGDSAESIDYIDRIINGASQLNDTAGNDLLAGRFHFLLSGHLSAGNIFTDVLRSVFNCPVPGAAIHIDYLKGVQGELGLRLGNGDYFGVINVGDDRELANLCEENGFDVPDRDFSESLFKALSATSSPVKILIGSKKFTQGWNSWRVSTMGLMNIGRSEGSEIIQLFGRGVRLKGYNECLKRSAFAHAPDIPANIAVVETLNVFGVRADYMSEFRKDLEEEGVKNKDDFEEIKLPCLRNFESMRLKYPLLKKGINYKKDAPRPVLAEPDDYLLRTPVIVDWYPRIEAVQSKVAGIQVAATLNTSTLGPEQCVFLDYEALYFELQKYKNERCYYNLAIEKRIIPLLLSRSDWYVLYIPAEELEFTSFNKVRMWQEIALTLLKKYCSHFYDAMQMNWEKDKQEYRYLDEVEAELEAAGKKGNLFEEYTFLVEKSRIDIIEKLRELVAQIEGGNFNDWSFRSLLSFSFNRHLYKPLIHIKDSEIRVSPVALNEGENQFVRDLKSYFEQHQNDFATRELYLLRNLGHGRGIGFFQAHNFHPDFIMWIVEGRKQQITFIDPHGLHNIQGGFNDPKIQFYREVKVLEAQIGDKDVSLESFLISVTGFTKIGLWDKTLSQRDFEGHHVLFQEDVRYMQKMFTFLSSS